MSKLYTLYIDPVIGPVPHPATQAEIDAAASEQMQQDAALGKMLRHLLVTYGKQGIEMHLHDESHGDESQFYAVVEVDDEPHAEAEGATLDEAFIAAGLLPKEDK